MLSRVPAARWGRARRSSEGFTYAGILFAVVVLGLALSTAGTVWSAASQRQREAELLWVGTQYMRAIESYYVHAPSGIRHYPRSLGELVEDRRGAVMRRHLRRLYPDPMTGQLDWELEQLADGAIVGLRSRSTKQPFRRVGRGPGIIDFAEAERYCDWDFVYSPQVAMPYRPGPPRTE
jgi:type II secretory pathway pseudopilin PulG